MKWNGYLFNGIWHVHTNYTDGENSISEYCDVATEIGAKLICFTEHVALDLSYNFKNYLSCINKARSKYGIIILGGVEVKILGNHLNAEKNVLEKADIIFGAIHGDIESTKEYLRKVEQLLKHDIDVWAHPTLPLKINNLKIDKKEIDRTVSLLKKKGITVEINVKYNVPDAYFISRCLKENVPCLIGLDAHSVEEVIRYWRG